MELLDTGIRWISWALAAYMVGSTIVFVIGVGIGAIKTKSALWWYLIYSVVVVGMMLAGLKYLPALVLQFSNEGIESAQPEMDRFAGNVRGIFDTAAGAGNSAPAKPTATLSPLGGPTDGSDPDAGGGGSQPTVSPILATPTLAPIATMPEPDYRATADARLATVTAAAAQYQATPGPTATYDILKPPTPIIQP
ncbi:MAG: hypothetical protein IPM39_15210 [Chloroflexi bacterium]|nr:hypothetical protein [Chloroflexota bacterium]